MVCFTVKLGVGGFSLGGATALYMGTCSAMGKFGNGNLYPLNLKAIVGLSTWLPCSRSRFLSIYTWYNWGIIFSLNIIMEVLKELVIFIWFTDQKENEVLFCYQSYMYVSKDWIVDFWRSIYVSWRRKILMEIGHIGNMGDYNYGGNK